MQKAVQSKYRHTRIENLRPIVVKLALGCYRRLPLWAKTVIEPEDLIQEGMLQLRHYQANTWDGTKSKFSTFAYRCLIQNYTNILEGYRMKKRAALTQPFELVQVRYRMELESWTAAKTGYRKIYQQASPRLRLFLDQLQGQKSQEWRRVKGKGKRFQALQSELLRLCRRAELSYTDFELFRRHGYNEYVIGGTDGLRQEVVSVCEMREEIF